MRAVSYKQDEVHSSPDGKTVCWLIYRGEYRVQTTDPEIAKVLIGCKGIKEVPSGVNFFMKQFSVFGNKIDHVLKLAKLPPRKIPQRKVEQGKRLSPKVEKAVSYKQNIEHWSEDGETHCWQIWTGEYWVYTIDRKVAGIIRRWKGIEEKERGEGYFYRLYKVPPIKIDHVIEAAKLPPRKKAK